MKLCDSPFGRSPEAAESVVSHQLPGSMLAPEFGEVNVARRTDRTDVTFTILMEPSASEGWQTGVAIDASWSMMGAFGKGLADGPKGPPPESLLKDYLTRGWLRFVEHSGNRYPIFSDAGQEDLVSRGHFVWRQNEVQPLARRVTAYLAENLDADGGTTLIYWACGSDGTDIELIGDFTTEDCSRAQFTGPVQTGFGGGTCLTPAVRYFAERFADANHGLYIFITDGAFSDLTEVRTFTIQMCHEIAAQKRNPLKCVLIGVGDAIDERQMEILDDLESGTDIDIWDHKIARDMRAIVEIFAEVVSENQIVAPSAQLFDASGNLIKRFSDGLPARVSFSMPPGSASFVLEVGGTRIQQPIG